MGHLLSGFELAEDVDIVLCANKYILTPKAIKDVLQTAYDLALCDGRSMIEQGDILQGVKQHSVNQLGRYATLINAVFTWDDLVIDEDQKREMQMICNQIKYRSVVGEEWGFHKKTPYGRGSARCSTALRVRQDYGGAGDGQRAGAGSLPHRSVPTGEQYIGETEKNISDLFRRAKTSTPCCF